MDVQGAGPRQFPRRPFRDCDQPRHGICLLYTLADWLCSFSSPERIIRRRKVCFPPLMARPKIIYIRMQIFVMPANQAGMDQAVVAWLGSDEIGNKDANSGWDSSPLVGGWELNVAFKETRRIFSWCGKKNLGYEWDVILSSQKVLEIMCDSKAVVFGVRDWNLGTGQISFSYIY